MLPSRQVFSRLLPLFLFTLLLLNASAAGLHPLWRVQGPKTTVHLAGSIHFLKAEHYPLPPVFQTAYSNASLVILETDMQKAQEPATAFRMLQLGSCPPGKTLKDLISTNSYARLQKHLGTPPGEPSPLDTFKPWFAALTLVVIELQRQGFSAEHGLDLHFLRKAQADRKDIGALESLDLQLSLFSSLTDTNQTQFLDQSLDEIGTFEKVFAQSVQAWQSGDMKQLDELLLQPMRNYPDIHRIFLTDRNRAWAERLAEYLKGDKPVFVVVGAGHLAGPDNLIDLLRQKGYSAQQL